MKSIHIIAGGTVNHIRPHFAVSAPAYGRTGNFLQNYLAGLVHGHKELPYYEVVGHYTKMAAGPFQTTTLETNDDIAHLVDALVANPDTKIIFMPVALCDFNPTSLEDLPGLNRTIEIGKEYDRLTSDHPFQVTFAPAAKIIRTIRRTRKDIFLVGFKSMSNVSEDTLFEAGLKLLKKSSCNLVFANDLKTKACIIVTPEQSGYVFPAGQRRAALEKLAGMALQRAQGTFTRSNVQQGDLVPWDSDMIPTSLRTVVNHLISRGAYRPFLGSTVGHFAFKVDDKTFLTSIRKTNFNNFKDEFDPQIQNGLVRVVAEDNDNVLAYGARPSVGGQSQRIIFSEHKDVDCIVHAHIPVRPGRESILSHRSQENVECGSHQCGQNTSNGLVRVLPDAPAYAVMLDKHGPNVVFHQSVDPRKIIDFIEENFDPTRQTSELR
jgi:hypothetical protein